MEYLQGILTIAVVVAMVWAYRWGWLLCQVPLRAFVSAVERLESELSNADTVEADRLYAARGFFEHDVDLQKCWDDYQRAMARHRHEGQRLLDPVPFFSYQVLIEDKGNRRISEVLPGAFTGLGILGTFVGLVVGLVGLDIGSTDEVRRSIGVLMGGMQTAFITSIVGVAFSLLWTYYDRMHVRAAQSALRKCHSLLRNFAPAPTHAALLENLISAQREQLATFKSFVTDTLIPEIISGIRGALEETLNPRLDRTVEVFRQFSDVASNKQVEGLNRMVDKFLENLEAAVGGQFQALSQTLREMVEWQKSVKVELSDLIDIVKAGAEAQKEALASSSELLTRVQDSVTAYINLKGVLSELEQSIQASVEKLYAVMEIFERTNQAAAAMLEERHRIESAIAAAHQAHVAELERHLNGLRQLWADAQESVARLNQTLTEGAESFSEHLRQGLSFTVGEFDKLLAEATQRLRVVVSGLNDAVGDLPDEMDRVVRELIRLRETVLVWTGKLVPNENVENGHSAQEMERGA